MNVLCVTRLADAGETRSWKRQPTIPQSNRFVRCHRASKSSVARFDRKDMKTVTIYLTARPCFPALGPTAMNLVRCTLVNLAGIVPAR